MLNFKQSSVIILVISALFLPAARGLAAEIQTDCSSAIPEVKALTDLQIDTPTLLKGYTVVSPDGNFFTGIRPEVLAVETRVIIKEYAAEQFDFPADLTPVSEVYEFDVFNKAAFQNQKPLLLKFNISEPTNERKRIFFYNGVIKTWVELPSYADGPDLVKSVIHLPYARLVILKDKAMEYGAASWYHYRGCDCAASPDYPKGTLLKVTNIANDKSVVIRVNDYGPDRSIHPERAIDLDSTAFSKIANLRSGIIPVVKVEKYSE